MTMPVKITDLINELVTQISSLPEFVNKSFSIYNIDEMENISTEGFPLVGVAYEGGELLENAVKPKAQGAHGAFLYRVSFSVILAVEYYSTLHADDTKVTALDLMDSIKQALYGFQGINTRPWIFAGEGPQPGGLEGVIFYGQLWQTDIPVIGNSLHP